jgi:hypothetical protein
VDAVVVILAGVVALGAAISILRSFGPRFRVGRMLAATRTVTIGEARELARSGRLEYVRVAGRIDSENEFEDADHRPLVFRLTRFESRRAGRWTEFDIVREAVPFELREGLDGIAITDTDLGDGLIVVSRESVGLVGDLGDRAPEALDDSLPARVTVTQLSSVEHAVVVGVASIGPDGAPRIGAGLGRPLILTTLEQPEAMRILAGGSARRPKAAAALFALAGVLLLLGLVLLVLPGSAFAASPDPTAVAGSDTRSPGEGPGLAGAPLAALLGVLGIGVLAALATLAYVRATGGPRRPDRP